MPKDWRVKMNEWRQGSKSLNCRDVTIFSVGRYCRCTVVRRNLCCLYINTGCLTFNRKKTAKRSADKEKNKQLYKQTTNFYPATVERHETVHQLLTLHCQIVCWLGMHLNKHGWKLFYELETSATEINTQTVSSCAHRTA